MISVPSRLILNKKWDQ